MVQLDDVLAYANFSQTEARFEDVENACRFAIELTAKQGGKLCVVLGNTQEYLPRVPDSDKTKRGYFYSSDANFSRLAADMHKFFTSVDLYVFSHKRNKNLGSLGEFTRLGGGDLCFYESAEPTERGLTSRQVLQRPHLQPGQGQELGDRVPDPLLGRLEEAVLRQLLREHVQRPAADGAVGRVGSPGTTPSCTPSSRTT